VVCPYHGWAIDGQGKLQDVPSAEPGHWPKRPIVSAYPVSGAWHVVSWVVLPSVAVVTTD
jgi:phenylpropionate dioxygenase-like ring-hydroxylating dioxygenase large terminal subunit